MSYEGMSQRWAPILVNIKTFLNLVAKATEHEDLPPSCVQMVSVHIFLEKRKKKFIVLFCY